MVQEGKKNSDYFNSADLKSRVVRKTLKHKYYEKKKKISMFSQIFDVRFRPFTTIFKKKSILTEISLTKI